MCFHIKTIYVSIEIPMQTHKYVHLTQDMSTYRFDYPMEVVTLDEGIYGKAAHIYINS